MKAVLDGIVIAEAPREELVSIEGNWYFPSASVDAANFEKSDTPYTCPWKGECQYFDVRIGGELAHDRAWSYPEPYPGAIERVGRDFSGYLAFDPRVDIVDD